MVTNFDKYNEKQLFDDKLNIQININLPDNLLNYLIDEMSFIVYKGRKRNEQKTQKL